ncbi:hypothetical protein CHARACLAT_013061 [Characodon lateralis]|uniref:Uncharacterized protein n=1 Tax=Characodon lateralis TaxID=208331 RepID=A0ABU7DSA0_9TELE|nr:hypothetical protein [Characodon lateralis]
MCVFFFRPSHGGSVDPPPLRLLLLPLTYPPTPHPPPPPFSFRNIDATKKYWNKRNNFLEALLKLHLVGEWQLVVNLPRSGGKHRGEGWPGWQRLSEERDAGDDSRIDNRVSTDETDT